MNKENNMNWTFLPQLPTSSGNVLVWNGSCVFEATYNWNENNQTGYFSEPYWGQDFMSDITNVIAWMQMPDPPSGESYE